MTYRGDFRFNNKGNNTPITIWKGKQKFLETKHIIRKEGQNNYYAGPRTSEKTYVNPNIYDIYVMGCKLLVVYETGHYEQFHINRQTTEPHTSTLTVLNTTPLNIRKLVPINDSRFLLIKSDSFWLFYFYDPNSEIQSKKINLLCPPFNHFLDTNIKFEPDNPYVGIEFTATKDEDKPDRFDHCSQRWIKATKRVDVKATVIFDLDGNIEILHDGLVLNSAWEKYMIPMNDTKQFVVYGEFIEHEIPKQIPNETIYESIEKRVKEELAKRKYKDVRFNVSNGFGDKIEYKVSFEK
jgi:hypothetical protein